MTSWIEYTDPVWRGLKMRNLDVDYASIRFQSHFNHTLWIYTLSEECYTCPYTKFNKLPPYDDKIGNLSVALPISFKVFDKDVGLYAFENESSFCDISPEMGEFGVYNFTVHQNRTCNFEVDKEPVDIYLSMLMTFFIVAALSCLLKLTTHLYKRYTSSILRPPEENVPTSNETTKKRLKSLDVFRGMTITLMIFVNSGGGHYWWIDHAPWNGLHVADIVFPCFLWIMGVCIPISIKSQRTKEIGKIKICKNILWRSIKLFFIGLCLNSAYGPKLENLRIMGVLQRFGIAYFVTATVHTIFHKGHSILPQGRIRRCFLDILIMKFELLFAVILIIFNLLITFLLNVPNCPKGYLGPGGKHSMVAHPNCIGGATGYIDREILTNAHIYQNPTAKYIYDSKAFDPEGVFGCLLTIVQVFFGMLCGVTLLTFPEWKCRIKRWIAWSIVLALLAGILCKFSKEDGWIPINKNLWTLSYVFATSAIAFFLLSFCYFIVDVKNYWGGHPFMEAGMNAIVMYVGHSVMHRMLPWHWKVAEMNTHFILLLENIWNTSIWVIIAIYLYKKKIFYTV